MGARALLIAGSWIALGEHGLLQKTSAEPVAFALAVVPGVAACGLVTIVAVLLQDAEVRVLGHPYLEALVLAILVGIIVRTFWTPGLRWREGIAFSAKQLLEVAVMLLGASLSLTSIIAAGPALLIAIVVAVVLSIGASYAISRLLRLPQRMSILIACGNSICGNSAIAAVAPVIGASGEDIASSIAFTAVLGVVMVLGLPLFIPLLQLTATQYGVLAGLTVYAVPQVLAATIPAGLVSTQVGTLVKLVRVLMLGPVVLAMSVVAPRLPAVESASVDDPATGNPGFLKLVPWFIIGFVALAGLRSMGLVPAAAIGPIRELTTVLTIVSMAALGLAVDVRVLGRVGGQVTAAVTGSLALLLVISIVLIKIIAIP